MKRKFWMLMPALALVLSCTNGPKQNSDSGSLTEEEYEFQFDKEKMEVELDIELPKAGKPLYNNAIREFVSEQLGGTYTGSLSDVRTMVDYYGNEIVRGLKEEYQEQQTEIDEEYINGFYRKIDIKPIYETDQLVTLEYEEMIYLNGAHGSETVFGVTFRKSDGRRLDYSMLRNLGTDDIHQLVKEGLRDYFGATGAEVDTDEKLGECIFSGNDIDYLPLPQHAPYATDKGLRFIYQQYEISSYALGMPEFTMSLKQMEPFLTQTAKELLND